MVVGSNDLIMMGCGWWQWNNGKLWVVAVKLWLIVGGCWWQQQNYGWLWVVVAGHELLFLVVSFSNVHTFDIFSYNWLSQKFLVVKVCIFQKLKIFLWQRYNLHIFLFMEKTKNVYRSDMLYSLWNGIYSSSNTIYMLYSLWNKIFNRKCIPYLLERVPMLERAPPSN